MKKIFNIAIASIVFIACNTKSDLNTNKDMIVTDTSAMYRSNMMTDTGSVIQTTTVPQNSAAANKPVVINNYYNTTPRSTAPRRSTSTRSSGTYANSGTSGQTTTTPTRRRGWSHAAKDATIGGVGGAVAGAVISKNKGKGAVIGGVLGAAGGYIIGRGKDKRDGR